MNLISSLHEISKEDFELVCNMTREQQLNVLNAKDKIGKFEGVIDKLDEGLLSDYVAIKNHNPDPKFNTFLADKSLALIAESVVSLKYADEIVASIYKAKRYVSKSLGITIVGEVYQESIHETLEYIIEKMIRDNIDAAGAYTFGTFRNFFMELDISPRLEE